jgi:hypothetical protein
MEYLGRHGQVLKELWDWVQADGFTSQLPLDWCVYGTSDLGVHSLDAVSKTIEQGFDEILSVSVANAPGNEAKLDYDRIVFSIGLMWVDAINPMVFVTYNIDQPALLDSLTAHILATLHRIFCRPAGAGHRLLDIGG